MTKSEIEFRKDPEKVAKARKVLENSTLKEMMVIALESMGPQTSILDPAITPHFGHIMLGIWRGEKRTYNLLHRLATHFVDSNQNQGEEAPEEVLEPED